MMTQRRASVLMIHCYATQTQTQQGGEINLQNNH